MSTGPAKKGFLRQGRAYTFVAGHLDYHAIQERPATDEGPSIGQITLGGIYDRASRDLEVNALSARRST